ncbi:MAG: DUF2541 family protein [Saprospiraceae bacterium]|nr:DUF2541 family protein [Saprospiraceae bacterium]
MKNKLINFNLLALIFIISSSFSTITDHAQGGKWELLGTKEVNFGIDIDEILVTAKEGTFKSIHLKIRRSALNMHKMTIHFADGSEQHVELKNNFRAGSQSRIIDLEGNNRIIRKVTMWYDTKNYKNRKALVELWGKH